jgi:Na+/melibiose symporter-like transporter
LPINIKFEKTEKKKMNEFKIASALYSIFAGMFLFGLLVLFFEEKEEKAFFMFMLFAFIFGSFLVIAFFYSFFCRA